MSSPRSGRWIPRSRYSSWTTARPTRPPWPPRRPARGSSACRSTSASAAPSRPATSTPSSAASTSPSRSTGTGSTTRRSSTGCSSRSCRVARTWRSARALRAGAATARRSRAASGISLFANLVSLRVRQRMTDTTSGFRAVNRRGIRLFAADYPHDYPEVESVVTAARGDLRIAEVPVAMRQRTGGQLVDHDAPLLLLRREGAPRPVRRPVPADAALDRRLMPVQLFAALASVALLGDRDRADPLAEAPRALRAAVARHGRRDPLLRPLARGAPRPRQGPRHRLPAERALRPRPALRPDAAPALLDRDLEALRPQHAPHPAPRPDGGPDPRAGGDAGLRARTSARSSHERRSVQSPRSRTPTASSGSSAGRSARSRWTSRSLGSPASAC